MIPAQLDLDGSTTVGETEVPFAYGAPGAAIVGSTAWVAVKDRPILVRVALP